MLLLMKINIYVIGIFNNQTKHIHYLKAILR
uniref:Uncharacterized protein n=1 Tax=Myoviridae sp. ctjhW4 TaxID=2825162 RepID=A0A8S5PT59_9CAUD|nr:MAG TPA: hypothetical protein [Myoviridae sp. ctjhW4]